jgi:hypothetical protein
MPVRRLERLRDRPELRGRHVHDGVRRWPFLLERAAVRERAVRVRRDVVPQRVLRERRVSSAFTVHVWAWRRLVHQL